MKSEDGVVYLCFVCFVKQKLVQDYFVYGLKLGFDIVFYKLNFVENEIEVYFFESFWFCYFDWKVGCFCNNELDFVYVVILVVLKCYVLYY